MKRKLSQFIGLITLLLLLIMASTLIVGDLIGNNITEEIRIRLEKEKIQTIIPTSTKERDEENIKYAGFNENEKSRYNEIINEENPEFTDISFTEDLSAERNITINGKVINLTYYFTNTTSNKNGFYKNPDNLNLTRSFDIYIDSNKNLYQFDKEFNKFVSYRKNDIFSNDIISTENTIKINSEQAKSIFYDFAKDLTADNTNLDPIVTSNEDGSYIIECINNDREYKTGHIFARITPTGDITVFTLNQYESEFITDEQLNATDAKLDNYIKNNYKNILSYTIYKTVGTVNSVPVVFYSVTMTEDNKYKSKFVESIVLRIQS